MKVYLAIKHGDKAQYMVKKLRAIFPNLGIEEISTPEEADKIFSVGGDGTLLYNIQKYLHLEKPLIGINAGSVGYLCRAHEDNMEEDLKEALNEEPLTFYAFDVTSEKLEEVAIAEVRVERPTLDCVRMKIVNNGATLAHKHIGDGIIITNSLGSTGYNDSAGGPILALDDKRAVLTPICPYKRGGEIYDSIITSQIYDDIDIEIITDHDARLVLENRGFVLTAGEPVHITYGKKKFFLHTKRKDERREENEKKSDTSKTLKTKARL